MKNSTFFRLFKKYSFAFFIATISVVVFTFSLVRGLDIISSVIDEFLKNQQLTDYDFLPKLVFYMFLAVVSSFSKSYFSKMFSVKIMYSIRLIISQKLVDIEYKYYDKNASGEIVAKLLSDIKALQKFIAEALPEIFNAVITLVFLLDYVFNINKWLLVAIVLSYPFVFITVKLISKRVVQLARLRRKFIDTESKTIYDITSGIETVKSYNLYDTMINRMENAMNDIFSVEVKRAKITSVMEAIRMILKWIPSIICLCFGSILTQNGDITVGMLMAFILITERVFEQLSSIPYYINESVDSIVSIQRIDEMLLEPNEKVGGISNFDFSPDKYAVDMKNVYFSYGENDVLSGLDIQIKNGQKVAIVGASGSGKSTMFKIISGFYKIRSGDYKAFGVNFDDVDITALRNNIAVISQDIFLFPTTIKENISYGNQSKNFDEIKNACKFANIDKFIESLPDGYETQTGERGVKLSGGEKQRISFARALLKNAKLLLMDEPTSALDSKNEDFFKQNLKNIGDEKTVIIIAHRLSTIIDCDKIFVMDNGKIVEQGTHNELLNKKGIYKKLYDNRFK